MKNLLILILAVVAAIGAAPKVHGPMAANDIQLSASMEYDCVCDGCSDFIPGEGSCTMFCVTSCCSISSVAVSSTQHFSFAGDTGIRLALPEHRLGLRDHSTPPDPFPPKLHS